MNGGLTNTDRLVDAWIEQNCALSSADATRICVGREMRYKRRDGRFVKCTVNSVGPLMSDGAPSGITVQFEDEDGELRERDTLASRLYR